VHGLEREIDHRVADSLATGRARTLCALVEVGYELIRLCEWIRTLWLLLLLLPALFQAIDARADCMECRLGSHCSLEEAVALLPQLSHAEAWDAPRFTLAIVGTTFVVLCLAPVVFFPTLARCESTTGIATVSAIGARLRLVFLFL
jgi:hypothetical protein